MILFLGGKMKVSFHSMGKGDMISFLLNLLLPVYIVISLSLVISHAKAIEHPRPNRDLARKEKNLHVSVRPKTDLNFYQGGEVQIACRAKGGKRIEEMPFINFFQLFEDGTHMVLQSGLIPGVRVIPHGDGDNRVKSTLHLNKNFWHILEVGENKICCKASDMLGRTSTDCELVYKKTQPTRRDRRRPYRYFRRFEQK